MRVVLASSSEEADIDALLAALGAGDAIDCVTSAGDVGGTKPSPEVFEVALHKASCDPNRTIVVGDTVWDVKAARRAGLECIGVLTGGIARGELEVAGALPVYRDVGEILAHLDEAPLVLPADYTVSLGQLRAELRARAEAATAHAACRVIRRRELPRLQPVERHRRPELLAQASFVKESGAEATGSLPHTPAARWIEALVRLCGRRRRFCWGCAVAVGVADEVHRAATRAWPAGVTWGRRGRRHREDVGRP